MIRKNKPTHLSKAVFQLKQVTRDLSARSIQAKPAQENNIDQSQTSPSSTEGSTVIATDSLTAIKTKIQENIRQQVQDGTASPAQIGAHSQRSLFGG